MRLLDLQIDGFGKLVNRNIRFDEKINIIYGYNEAGKSTLHACIRAMLYGMPRSRGVAALNDAWSHYKPWNSSQYGAVLRVEYEGRTYAIRRDFDKDPIGLSITDEESNDTIPYPSEYLKNMLCNLSLSSYDNTISIGQLKSAADESMPGEIKKYIVNMDTTGNRALNCEKAKDFLTAQKRTKAEGVVTDAAKNYALNVSEIKKLESEIDKPEYISKIRETEDLIEECRKKVSANDDERKKLAVEITDESKDLEKSNFSSRAEIDMRMRDLSDAISDYRYYKDSGKIKGRRALWIVFAALGLISLFVAFLGKFIKNFLDNPTFVLFIILGGIFLALGIIFLIATCLAKKTLSKKRKLLENLLGDDKDISEEATEKTMRKLRDLSKLAFSTENKAQQISELYKARQELAKQTEETEQELAKQKATQEDLMKKIVTINELRDKNETLKVVMARNDSINDELEAIDIALETIDALSKEMKTSFGLHLNKEASAMISDITGGVYDSMHIDDELGVWMNTKDKMVPIEQVSSGTADQIYLALRLATAKLMQSGKPELPLIFDDSFVNYDDARLSSVLDWISRSYPGQVLLFTCHTRESALLDENEISYNKIELPS